MNLPSYPFLRVTQCRQQRWSTDCWVTQADRWWIWENICARKSIHIGSPSHFRGVWANLAPRREAPWGRMAPRLPWNDWGNVLLPCTCVTSRAAHTKKKEEKGRHPMPTPLGLYNFAKIKETERMMPTPFFRKAGEYWTARTLISQSAFVIP